MRGRESQQAVGMMRRLTGRAYPKVEQMLDGADRETQMQMIALLRDIESAINREKRSFQPFPGGPAIRM